MRQWLTRQLEISHGHNKPMPSMEGLRGIAVFLVFWVHYSSLVEPWVSGRCLDVLHFIHRFGHLGVDLFFVLSGYLIYGSIMSKPRFAAGRYARRRAQRIYPTFLTVFAIYVALSVAFPGESKLPEAPAAATIYIAQNLLLLPGILDIEPIITVAWSLSYEAFYYLLTPLVIFALRLKHWSVAHRICFWLIVAGAGFGAHFLWGGPVRLLMFVAGILLFELFANLNWTLRRGGGLCLLAALALAGLSPSIHLDTTFLMLAVFVLFLLLCLCAFSAGTRTHRWLTFTPLRWLGNMSYSYYLIHGLTLKFSFLLFAYFAADSFSSASLYYWLWGPLFALTLITSFVLFILVEKPFSLSRQPTAKAANRTRPPATVVPAEVGSA